MKKWIALALRLLLAAVFLLAAYSKLKQSYLIFALSIDAYQILPEWAVLWTARTLPWFELALGVLLIIGWQLRWTSIASAGLLAVFLAILIYSYNRGAAIDCACFGVGEPLSAKTLVRDGLLFAASAALVWLSWPNAVTTAARSIPADPSIPLRG